MFSLNYLGQVDKWEFSVQLHGLAVCPLSLHRVRISNFAGINDEWKGEESS